MRRWFLAFAALATPAAAQAPAATEIARWPAAEARQGVAADARYVYAIDNNAIGKYDKTNGRRVAHWEGPRALYPHMNSCAIERAELVCAASNHPEVPMASVVEVFDTATLRHIRSIALPPYSGSLTWLTRRGTDWYALFANYSADHGGEPGHDTRWTILIRFDDQFRATRSWHFPDDILARFAPMSASGGAWGEDGLLYVTGHDAAELYALRLPEAGTKLEHVATITLPTGGQAIGWDPAQRRVLWTIDRKTRSVVASRVPSVLSTPKR